MLTPPDADVALGLAGRDRCLAGDERVGEHHGAGAAGASGEVGADPAHRLGERGLVAAGGQVPRLPEVVGVEVGQAVDRDRPVVVAEQHRGADAGGMGAQVHAGGVDELGPEAEPLGGVVVAAGHHQPGAGGGDPGERLVGQPDRVDGRQRPVVDVTREHHQVDALGLHDLEQVVDVRRLVAEHALPVEGPPEMPVGGVEDAHPQTVGGGTDSLADPRRSGGPNASGSPAGGAARRSGRPGSGGWSGPARRRR